MQYLTYILYYSYDPEQKTLHRVNVADVVLDNFQEVTPVYLMELDEKIQSVNASLANDVRITTMILTMEQLLLSTEKKTAVPVEKKNAVSVEKKNVVSVEKKNAVSVGKKNAVSVGKKNAVSVEKKTAVPVEKKNAVSVEKKTAVPVEKKNAVSVENKKTFHVPVGKRLREDSSNQYAKKVINKKVKKGRNSKRENETLEEELKPNISSNEMLHNFFTGFLMNMKEQRYIDLPTHFSKIYLDYFVPFCSKSKEIPVSFKRFRKVCICMYVCMYV